MSWRQALNRWWQEFSLQTKLLAVATLVVSLLMTGITFLALNGIQRDAQLGDTRYARDLGLLLSANVTPLVAEGNAQAPGHPPDSPAPQPRWPGD